MNRVLFACACLLAGILVPEPAHAQRPRLQHEPELQVHAPSHLVVRINNITTTYPPIFAPPTDPTLGYIGVSIFYKVPAPGDTIDIGRVVGFPPVRGDLVITQSATGDPNGCEPIVTDLTGKIAFVQRGPSDQTPPGSSCFFNQKAWHAQNAGAIGVVIYNQERPDDNAVNMSAGDTSLTVTIPAVQLPRGMARPMLDALAEGSRVCVTVTCSEEADPTCAPTPPPVGQCSVDTGSEPEAPGSFTDVVVSPNPLSGTGTLTLRLARPEAVRVEVLDALGRQVTLLHGGPLAAGQHRLSFEASAFPPGVYVVRVCGETFTRSARVVRVR